MTFETRRIVTGHDDRGTAIFVSDEQIPSVSRGVGNGIVGCEIWSTDAMPVDNGREADARQRAGLVRVHNYVGSGGGSTVRINRFEPGNAFFMHRTTTLDYAIMISGELELELDDGASVTLRPGDVAVQRGTMHAWINRSAEPATIAFILLDAMPADGEDGKLGDHFERPSA